MDGHGAQTGPTAPEGGTYGRYAVHRLEGPLKNVWFVVDDKGWRYGAPYRHKASAVRFAQHLARRDQHGAEEAEP